MSHELQLRGPDELQCSCSPHPAEVGDVGDGIFAAPWARQVLAALQRRVQDLRRFSGMCWCEP